MSESRPRPTCNQSVTNYTALWITLIEHYAPFRLQSDILFGWVRESGLCRLYTVSLYRVWFHPINREKGVSFAHGRDHYVDPRPEGKALAKTSVP
eukprot:6209867-Pleurochrysis_carterae.AAC.2